MGHYLYDTGQRVIVDWANPLPFRMGTLDGGLLPTGGPEEQGKLHLAIINDWTVLGMWDRTADSRRGSNASFIAEGVHTVEQMRVIAERDFPIQHARIWLST